MMKLIRWFLGKVILFLNAVFPPSNPVSRDQASQMRIDQETRSLILYQFEACPFCVKVRRTVKRLGLTIELRDAKVSPYSDELLKGGGQLQVPCLKITDKDGKIRWLYESSEINAYLENRFAPQAAVS
jgi:glutaredoxin